MTIAEFEFLINKYNPTASTADKWKCVKYIINKNPILDVQRAINRGEIEYIKKEGIGAGFFIMSSPDASLGVTSTNEKIITYIPLESIEAIGFITDNEE